MANHPNRGRANPAAIPAPDQVRRAREAAGLTQTQAAHLVHSTLVAWQRWEAGDRRMHPTMFEMFLLRTGQHASFVVVPREPYTWALTEAEWNALRDLLRGCSPDPLWLAAQSLVDDWVDATLDGGELPRKWGVDADALTQKLRAMDSGQRSAIIVSVSQWWRTQ